MTSSLVLMLVLTAAPAPAKKEAKKPADAPTTQPGLLPKKSAVGHLAVGLETKCGSCHTADGWTEVKFNHDKTGFLLRGQHSRVSCKRCHAADFKSPVPMGCAGCHDDAHAGDLGQRCDACHDEKGWPTGFTADAHRRNNFPLFGAHAALPCLECHPDARERRFARPSVPCVGCHQNDVARTRGTAVDHQALGFPDTCLTCHGPVRFTPARFTAHETCFSIRAGPHAVPCLTCHDTLSVKVATPGLCATGTARCTACHTHTHDCAGPMGTLPTDKLHAQVAGYQCKDRKCYECHQFGGAP